MVSKVAVIAIVGILAVPILLGYALNLEQVTETDYEPVGDSVNVTQLLQTGTDYTYAHADSYQLNTNFTLPDFNYAPTIPQYSMTNVKSSFNLSQMIWTQSGLHITFREYADKFAETTALYTAPGQNERFIIRDTSSNIVLTVNYFINWYYDASSLKLYYQYYTNSSFNTINSNVYNIPNNNYSLEFIKVSGTFDVLLTLGRSNATNYVDFSAGYVLNNTYRANPYVSGENYSTTNVKLPDYSRSVLLTIDLSSIIDANYRTTIDTYAILEKTTTDGIVKWELKQRPMVQDGTLETTELYYDQTTNNNTYQIKIWAEQEGYPAGNGFYNTAYTRHYDCRYIGAWSETIGEANYYKLISATTKTASNAVNIKLGGFSDHSPIVRVDDAEFRAMEYPIISDKTYNPSSFKENPTTTINNITFYGTSINFGGNAYLVKNGNITLGTHQIPVKGLTLSSIPNGNGGYDNKIGETTVSTTAQPSEITFNGKWSASITTAAQEEHEYTKTEWIAGGFAWDGIDHNFLIVGLFTSLGAFIALGIYARRSKGNVLPLMLVCGGAAMVFFVML